MLCLPSNSGIEGFLAGFINMVKLFSDSQLHFRLCDGLYVSGIMFGRLTMHTGDQEIVTK
jgi:hypothetical protein